MPFNVESKTRCGDLRRVAELAAAAGARHEGGMHQVDTYFVVEAGRLKLREVVLSPVAAATETWAELIRYTRPDTTGARVSAYERTPVVDLTEARSRLETEHGIRGVVEKRRELWTLGDTRIHLDTVTGLGAFVELETVAADAPTAADHAEHDRVFHLLHLDPAATVDGSYVDLVAATRAAPGPASVRTRR